MSDSLPPFKPSTAIRTDQPNPNWDYGQKVSATAAGREWEAGSEAGWKGIDTSKVDPGSLYPLMISGIIPRPVGFVSSISEEGVHNLALFSWFNMVTHNPPLVSLSISDTSTGLKDTPRNIKATKEFVVNIISEPFIEQANSTCIDSPPDVSEWPLSGLTKAPSVLVKPPRVKESAFSMECELYQVIDITEPSTGKHTTTLILGHVKYIHVRNDVLTERGVIDPVKFKPIARLGDISYANFGSIYRMPRPRWADDEGKVRRALESEGVKAEGDGGKL